NPLAGESPGRAAADHDRPAGGAADRADRRDRRRDDDGRLWPRGRNDDRVTLRGFARGVRWNRGNCGGRLCPGQADGPAEAAPVAVASGSAAAEYALSMRPGNPRSDLHRGGIKMRLTKWIIAALC